MVLAGGTAARWTTRGKDLKPLRLPDGDVAIAVHRPRIPGRRDDRQEPCDGIPAEGSRPVRAVWDTRNDGVDGQAARRSGDPAIRRERLTTYAEARKHAVVSTAGSVWDVPCDVALPCATQNELDEAHAITLVKNGVIAVVEGANMPNTPAAIAILREAGVLFGPGKAANAGGVATSALEMQQNAIRRHWTF